MKSLSLALGVVAILAASASFASADSSTSDCSLNVVWNTLGPASDTVRCSDSRAGYIDPKTKVSEVVFATLDSQGHEKDFDVKNVDLTYNDLCFNSHGCGVDSQISPKFQEIMKQNGLNPADYTGTAENSPKLKIGNKSFSISSSAKLYADSFERYPAGKASLWDKDAGTVVLNGFKVENVSDLGKNYCLGDAVSTSGGSKYTLACQAGSDGSCPSVDDCENSKAPDVADFLNDSGPVTYAMDDGECFANKPQSNLGPLPDSKKCLATNVSALDDVNKSPSTASGADVNNQRFPARAAAPSFGGSGTGMSSQGSASAIP